MRILSFDFIDEQIKDKKRFFKEKGLKRGIR